LISTGNNSRSTNDGLTSRYQKSIICIGWVKSADNKNRRHI
jgi:hypothetical protein